MLQTNRMHQQLTWGKTTLKRLKPTFHFTPKPLALRIMGSQNWWFGDPGTLPMILRGVLFQVSRGHVIFLDFFF